MLRPPSQVCFPERHTPLHQPFLNVQRLLVKEVSHTAQVCGAPGSRPLETFQAAGEVLESRGAKHRNHVCCENGHQVHTRSECQALCTQMPFYRTQLSEGSEAPRVSSTQMASAHPHPGFPQHTLVSDSQRICSQCGTLGLSFRALHRPSTNNEK